MKNINILVKDTPIQEIGSYLEVDADGYLINPASKKKIQEEWRPLVTDIIEEYKFQYGDKLHSVYIRGSVSKGEAVKGISDVDTFAYITSSTSQINREWIKSFEKETITKYSFCNGIELIVDSIDNAKYNRLFILQSVCVYGHDLTVELPKIKMGDEVLSHIYSFSNDLNLFDNMEKSPDQIKQFCVWFMKRFIRTGLELTISSIGKYTRDLYPSYKSFAECYPEKDAEMKEVLYLSLNPTDDFIIIKRIRDNLGVWIEDQINQYLETKKTLH